MVSMQYIIATDENDAAVLKDLIMFTQWICWKWLWYIVCCFSKAKWIKSTSIEFASLKRFWIFSYVPFPIETMMMLVLKLMQYKTHLNQFFKNQLRIWKMISLSGFPTRNWATTDSIQFYLWTQIKNLSLKCPAKWTPQKSVFFIYDLFMVETMQSVTSILIDSLNKCCIINRKEYRQWSNGRERQKQELK